MSSIVPQRQAPKTADEECFEYGGDGPWYTCDPTSEYAPKLAKKGIAGSDSPPLTMFALLRQGAERKPDKPALLVERPLPAMKDGKAPPAYPRENWTQWTLKQYHEDVRSIAKGFISLGMNEFDTINIWGFNSPEWFISAIAAMYAGGKAGGLYPTDTDDIAAYKVVHSSASVICVDDYSKAEKLKMALDERGDCRKVRAFVTWAFEPAQGATLNVKGCGDVPLFSWKGLLAKAAGTTDAQLDARANAVKPGNCCALIYTSGTTGYPKAVMISHDNVAFSANCMLSKVLGPSCGLSTLAVEERTLSYLPLSHIAGMMLDIGLQLGTSAFTPASQAVFFARPYDIKANAIKDRLGVARPTCFLGVPLVWEKMADKIRAIGAAGSATQQKIGNWAKSTNVEYARNIQVGGTAAKGGCACLAETIMKKVKVGLGLDAMKVAITGAAPIRVDTVEYYGSLGIFINECYGMSESTGACTVSTDLCHEWGSCGWEAPGTQIRAFLVDHQDFNKVTECPRAPSLKTTEEKYQGELCFRGRNIMMGYMACLEMGATHIAEMTQKNAETIDRNGWLHSGDKGLITVQGMVRITGRYKELIIGDGGENIAPVPIEDSIKGLVPGVCEVMMIGDKRKYNVCLVTLKAVGANGESPGTDQLDMGAKTVNPAVQTITAAMKDPVWIETVSKAIKDTNANGQCCPNKVFHIQKFTILPTNFSEEGNELTPTKKLKRSLVENKYADVIEKMYTTNGVYISFD